MRHPKEGHSKEGHPKEGQPKDVYAGKVRGSLIATRPFTKCDYTFH